MSRLNGEEEVLGNSTYPIIDIPRIRWSIECAVDLYGVEELAVVFQFVNLPGRVELTSPGSLTPGVRPAGCTNVNFSLTGNHTYLQ